MASPFPGMDPYFESTENWQSFHHHLAEEITATLNRELSRKYFAEVEVHTIIDEVGIGTHSSYPDAAIIEGERDFPHRGETVAIAPAPHSRTAVTIESTKSRAVRVYLSATKELVTTIELLSPANKRGRGLDQYREKRRLILLSAVHFVEIDLLRGGERPGWELNDPPFDADYILLVNRESSPQRTSEIWDVALSDSLPTLPIPLLPPDPDIALNIQRVLETIYQRHVYDRRIDYTQPIPPPPLRPAMQAWWDTQPIGS
ncbi:MAG: DUF4058 family protein [Caldilineaceae bacterium]|nr:DUF4058 family protein [Caldilineaceae bacterium]